MSDVVYRVVERKEGTTEWTWSVRGYSGVRTYRTLGTARGALTMIRQGHERYRYRDGAKKEFKVQASVMSWEDIDD